MDSSNPNTAVESLKVTPLSLLFVDSDKIFSCNLQSSGGQINQKVFKLSEFESNSENEVNREFFCINPVRGQRNLRSEVSAYRNFLFESDSVSIEAQLDMLPKLIELEIFRTITFSGSKSLHCIVSIADTLNLGEPGSAEATDRYKQIWQGLRDYIESSTELKIDPSNCNPTVLSRFPEAVRVSTSRVQELLHVGTLLPADVVSSFCKTTAHHGPKNSSVIVKCPFSGNFQQLEDFLWRTENQNFFRFFLCPNWVNSTNNYDTLRNLVCWSVDLFNCDETLFLQLVEKYLEPEFRAVGYYRDNASRILQIFKWKRLKDRFSSK